MLIIHVGADPRVRWSYFVFFMLMSERAVKGVVVR
jgi:hypothetical protein